MGVRRYRGCRGFSRFSSASPTSPSSLSCRRAIAWTPKKASRCTRVIKCARLAPIDDDWTHLPARRLPRSCRCLSAPSSFGSSLSFAEHGRRGTYVVGPSAILTILSKLAENLRYLAVDEISTRAPRIDWQARVSSLTTMTEPETKLKELKIAFDDGGTTDGMGRRIERSAL